MVRWCAVMVLLASASVARADVGLPTVMDHRWGAAVSYGASGLRARTDAADASLMAALDFALRFRLRPELELGASLTGAVRRTYGYAALVADLRYRYQPERPWNGFAFAGAGLATWSPADGWQALVRGGVGVERRFARWAFSADLRLTWIGADTSVVGDDTAAMLEQHGAWDAAVSIAVLYYWGRGRPSRRLVP